MSSSLDWRLGPKGLLLPAVFLLCYYFFRWPATGWTDWRWEVWIDIMDEGDEG